MATTALTLSNTTFGRHLVPIGDLDRYVRFAYSVPMLEESEERELAERLKRYNDIEAAHRLVLSHLRFVIKIARGFNGYGLALSDLIQEGTVGLMKAVKRFDPKLGVRLVSFAVHWIKSEIHEFVIRNWRIVKIATTKAQRKLFFNLRSTKKRLGWFSTNEVNAVASELNVKPEEVLEMEQRLNAMDAAFDAPDEETEGDTFSPSHYLQAPNSDPVAQLVSEEQQEQTTMLQQQLETLDARSQDILARRWLSEEKTTLSDLAAHYQVSIERIRQIETQAMQKLRQALQPA